MDKKRIIWPKDLLKIQKCECLKNRSSFPPKMKKFILYNDDYLAAKIISLPGLVFSLLLGNLTRFQPMFHFYTP